MNFKKETPARCNRCDKKFELPKDRQGDEDNPGVAYRLWQFCECPHCKQTDCHWVYVADLEQVTK
jgi:hypothetical protein